MELATHSLARWGNTIGQQDEQDYRWETPRLAAFNLVLMEFGDFAMERRMLKGIKVRAELTNGGARHHQSPRTMRQST